MRRHTLTGLVVTALAAAAGLVGVVPPASAAQCSAAGGVSVVVDFGRGAGGGVQTACAPDGGGKYASTIFPSAGFPLEYVGGSGGFVCRVKSAPAGADCSTTSPADAYWGLFWAKKGASTWSYASAGVSTLKVPDGGSVAWSFQNGGDTDVPGVPPSARAPVAPTKAPTKAPAEAPAEPSKPSKPAAPSKPTKPTKAPGEAPDQGNVQAPTAKPQVPGQSGPARPAASGVPSAAVPSAGASVSTNAPSALGSPSTSPDSGATPAAGSGGDAGEGLASATTDGSLGDREDGGLPLWVPATLIVVLAGAAGGGVWRRNRRGA